MKLSFLRLFFIAVFFCMTNSCKKQAPICSGNCGTINANGNVRNKLTNTIAANVPVSLRWTKFVGLVSQSLIITTVNSKSDGSFNFTSSIDTTYFNNGYNLALSVGSNDEYLILGYSGKTIEQTHSFDQNAFQGIVFDVFKKSTLKINLHRIQNDNFESFSISHSNVDDNFFIYDYNVASPQEVINRNTSELNVSTVADIYTKVKVRKSFSNGTYIERIDSIKCASNSLGVYEVNF